MMKYSTWAAMGCGACTLLLIVSVGGCQLWPFMTDEDGRRPLAMGKNDQVMYPDAQQPAKLSEDFGRSFQTAVENQILNPDAGKNLEPVTGLGGMAGQKAIERYQKSFEEPPFDASSGEDGDLSTK